MSKAAVWIPTFIVARNLRRKAIKGGGMEERDGILSRALNTHAQSPEDFFSDVSRQI